MVNVAILGFGTVGSGVAEVLSTNGGLIDQRVKAIVSGQHRDHYGSAAALAAALGEVKESRGEVNGKQKALLEYKGLYSRRSAFHRELRAMGMKG